MNITKALKEKNRLINEYNTTLDKAVTSNSHIVGAVVKYNTREQFAKAVVIQEELIQLKTKIHKARKTDLPVMFVHSMNNVGTKNIIKLFKSK